MPDNPSENRSVLGFFGDFDTAKPPFLSRRTGYNAPVYGDLFSQKRRIDRRDKSRPIVVSGR
jgi:hypothetical protein